MRVDDEVDASVFLTAHGAPHVVCLVTFPPLREAEGVEGGKDQAAEKTARCNMLLLRMQAGVNAWLLYGNRHEKPPNLMSRRQDPAACCVRPAASSHTPLTYGFVATTNLHVKGLLPNSASPRARRTGRRRAQCDARSPHRGQRPGPRRKAPSRWNRRSAPRGGSRCRPAGAKRATSASQE